MLEIDEPYFVFLGYPECPWSIQISPVLKQIENDLDIRINYLNTNTLIQQDYEDLKNTAEVFQNQWGTPMLIVIKDKKVNDSLSGYREKEELTNFFKKHKDSTIRVFDEYYSTDEPYFEREYEDEDEYNLENSKETKINNSFSLKIDNTFIIVMLGVVIVLLIYLIFTLKKRI